MNPLIMHIGSGMSFFTGLGLIIISAILSFFDRKLSLKIISGLGFLLGAIGVITASIPQFGLPYLILPVIAVLLLLMFMKADWARQASFFIKGLLIFLCTCSVLLEAPHLLLPNIQMGNYDKLYVIGDSISAGIQFDGEKCWSEVFKEKYGVKVANLAVAGTTLSTVLPTVDGIKDEKALVLLEIGGNDIFDNDCPSRKFRADLEVLLKKVCRPGRTVIMFELPLYPFSEGIISAQRELSRQYGVYLVPRYIFSGFITGAKRTVDGLHLSNYGHEKMAEGVWGIVKKVLLANKL